MIKMCSLQTCYSSSHYRKKFENYIQKIPLG